MRNAQPTENDPRFIERDALKPEELFPLGVKVMSMRVPLKGSIGTVVGHSGANISVEFALTPQVRAEEEFFGSRLVAIERDDESVFMVRLFEQEEKGDVTVVYARVVLLPVHAEVALIELDGIPPTGGEERADVVSN